ncbi:aldo/keto reductase [Embleya sp. NPDC001921]
MRGAPHRPTQRPHRRTRRAGRSQDTLPAGGATSVRSAPGVGSGGAPLLGARSPRSPASTPRTTSPIGPRRIFSGSANPTAWCSCPDNLGTGGRTRSAVTTVAERHGASAARIALAWLLTNSPVLLPVVAPSTPQQLDAYWEAAEIDPSDIDLDTLNTLPRRHIPVFARVRARARGTAKHGSAEPPGYARFPHPPLGGAPRRAIPRTYARVRAVPVRDGGPHACRVRSVARSPITAPSRVEAPDGRLSSAA